jgi:hypothetical protein
MPKKMTSKEMDRAIADLTAIREVLPGPGEDDFSPEFAATLAVTIQARMQAELVLQNAAILGKIEELRKDLNHGLECVNSTLEERLWPLIEEVES